MSDQKCLIWKETAPPGTGMVAMKSLVEMNNVKCEICGMEMKMGYIDFVCLH